MSPSLLPSPTTLTPPLAGVSGGELPWNLTTTQSGQGGQAGLQLDTQEEGEQEDEEEQQEEEDDLEEDEDDPDLVPDPDSTITYLGPRQVWPRQPQVWRPELVRQSGGQGVEGRLLRQVVLALLLLLPLPQPYRGDPTLASLVLLLVLGLAFLLLLSLLLSMVFLTLEERGGQGLLLGEEQEGEASRSRSRSTPPWDSLAKDLGRVVHKARERVGGGDYIQVI